MSVVSFGLMITSISMIISIVNNNANKNDNNKIASAVLGRLRWTCPSSGGRSTACSAWCSLATSASRAVFGTGLMGTASLRTKILDFGGFDRGESRSTPLGLHVESRKLPTRGYDHYDYHYHYHH